MSSVSPFPLDATMREIFASVAKARPDAACIAVPPSAGRAYHPEGMEQSYGEVERIVQTLAEAYSAAGYGPGHRVAFSLENRPDLVHHWLALNGLGASTVPINPDYRKEDLSFLLDHSECDLVVALPDRVEGLSAVASHCGDMPVVALQDVMDGLPPARRPASAGRPGPDTETALLYTSGTTGMPKACRLTNAYFRFAGQRYIEAGGLMQIEAGAERLYNPLPLFYANSFAISNPAMILSGNCMIFPDRFHPRSFWADLVATRATIIHYLGIIPPVLLSMPESPDEQRHKIKFGVGAGVDPDQQVAFERRFGFPLVEVWGMSEVGIASAVNQRPRTLRRRSIGMPLAGVTFDVVDDDDRPVRDGTPGELVVRRTEGDPRAGFFGGYFKSEAETEHCWRNGAFHTGDIVAREPDGSFVFVDRKKHMIRRSGQNIAAAEVENVLGQHPDIAQIAVVPVADPLREEEVMACVVLKDPLKAGADTARSICEFAVERLAYFKAPGWVAFLAALPTTSTQKLRKSAIFPPDHHPALDPACFDTRQVKGSGRASANHV
jgi:crotonobetaine/carnitine-CoA ligase